jgi:hypothetical protein
MRYITSKPVKENKWNKEYQIKPTRNREVKKYIFQHQVNQMHKNNGGIKEIHFHSNRC